MKKIFLFLSAVMILTACDNLKKKSVVVEDDETEETTTKKDKGEEESEEYIPSKKNNDNSTTSSSNEDVSEETWNDSYRKQFVDICVGGAKEGLGEAKAQDYCECAVKKVEAMYPNPANAGNLTDKQKSEIATDCLK